MANIATKPALFFGKIVTSDLPKFVKVSISKYVLDQRLRMYFKEKTEVYACDKNNECNEGDYVTIKEIPESQIIYAPEGNKVKYHVDKLVYKLGYIIDPISGKRCAGVEYTDDIKKITELFNYKRPYFNAEKTSSIE